MANITVTIPDQHVTRVIEALTKTAGLTATPANAKKALVQHIKDVTLNYESRAKHEEYKLASEQLEQTYSAEQETAKTKIDNIAIT